MNILHLDSSILGDQSVSRKISAAIVARLTCLNRDAQVIYRDLVANPIPHLTMHTVQALSSVADVKDEPVGELALAIRVLDEVLAADIIVIGAPMYNFSIASQLKAWLDAIIVPGRTFEYSSSGVRGLLQNKRVIIASSRGGFYALAGEGNPAEFQESLLSQLLKFVGIEDIGIVRAEGVRMGEDHALEAIEAALRQVGMLELNEMVHADDAASVA